MEDSGSRLPTRHDFPHLTDAHWATLEKMVSLLGEAAFAGFSNLSAEQQKARVERFDKYESSLIAHVSAAAQEAARAAMRAEAQSAAQASATNAASFAARPTTTKPVKISIPTFDGKDSNSLVFWVREIEIALSAGQIYDARAQVAFALSNLGGRARAWAMVRETATPGYFTSWSFMEQELRSTFLLANVAYRRRSNFLRCKQGKRSLQDHVMELHNLEAAMAGAPLSEDVKVTVFMDGVRTGPVRTELFRRQPMTFNEAVQIAMLEDHCVRSVSSSPASQKEQVPGTTLLCLSVVAARSNLVVVTASVKGYPEPMAVLIDSGASFNFATKASVAKNNALYASALEASKSNTNVSVRLATGSIVSTRKVTIPLKVRFDDFDSVEPFIVLNMDDRYDLILGMPWLAKHEPWIVWRSRTIGASHNPLADRALVGHVPSSSRDGFVHEHRVPRDERQFAGLQKSWNCQRVGAGARATTGGRAGAPTSTVIRGDKVTNTPKADASDRDADPAAEDRAPQALDVFTGEPKVGEVLARLPTVAELLELEELSYVEFLDSLKAGELAEVVLLRPEGGSLELNSSSVMDSAVLEDARTSRRQMRYGAAILKDPSDPYYPLLKEFSDVVSDDPPLVLPPDRCVRHEIDLVPGTKGLSNAPATFNRLVTQLFRPMRHFVQTYFDDIFVHSRASEGKTAVEAHLGHLREVLLCMRENHLYANINKCIFGADEIPFMGCFLGKNKPSRIRRHPHETCQEQYVDLKSVGSAHSHLSEYYPDDLNADVPARAAVAATDSSGAGTGSATRIRVSAISDLKEFSGKDRDEDRARSWFSQVKAAFVRDQALDSEKCLVFGDLLKGPARNCTAGAEYLSRDNTTMRKRLDESPLEYLYRLIVAGLRAQLSIKDGSTEARREHVDHFIETLDDLDLANQRALLIIPDADILKETLRSQERAKARQGKTVYGSIRPKPKVPAGAAPSANVRAVRAVRATANSSDSDPETSGSGEEGVAGYWKYHVPDKKFRQAKATGKSINEKAALLFNSGAEVSILVAAFARMVGRYIDNSQELECEGVGKNPYMANGVPESSSSWPGRLSTTLTSGSDRPQAGRT
ncbi:unnamed protein product [Phytophthora fragariaefolia]|uniref:Unnamed protein product n=1 Tax=Phytophthora fragariaefolia TaxID=1490495 RepID=A0A9W6XY44_9STRA|nr:unnamed protein product [Phytophthora fragariaefolia]